jgi:choloylglycine hydrolase
MHVFILAGLFFILSNANSYSCTLFLLKAKDGNLTVARSMEFGIDLKYDLVVVPRNQPYFSPSPVSKTGLK